MAADGGRLRTAQAAQACAICKTRKKKCSKSLPSCEYCTRKELDCVYALDLSPQNHAAPTPDNSHTAPNWGTRPPVNAISSQLTPETTSQVYLEVHGIIRATGQFVDDISARYFQGFHRHLPIVSRTRFYNNITLGAAPAADVSVLLLVICLITYAPALGYQSRHEAARPVKQHSLYLTARSLFAQVQVSCTPSVPLIQAAILLAVYEYTHGRPDDALTTITGSARMAYAARIHTGDRLQTQMTRIAGHNADIDFLLQAEEAANTWWGIVVYERIFLSEATVFDQPMVTVFPGGDARLPIEPQVLDQLDLLDLESLPNIPVSCLTSPKVGGFSRTTQATCLLDLVLKSFNTPAIDSRLLQLDRLNTNIQALLSLVMPQCQDQSGGFCTALHIAIRALFQLHWHILDQPSQAVIALFNPLEEWQKRSQEALDTVTKIVFDTAESLVAASPVNTVIIDSMPPTYPYIARAALRHIHSDTRKENVACLKSAEEVIQTSLDKYFKRWSVGDK
ncbi:hypothetical protein G7Z17_g1640 [Cylindrodendrum hubeiense]|uniref:Zn(2)-C6 fungal-type domain-containing protein n=1 Tax=Cylindrodendrum hubeiense TaxID=595255 RepID=A0A9P5LLW5_9HYPO|nr:hypothetical protein G7Z17_g1640 [Cylindrodendrum hubeiense]